MTYAGQSRGASGRATDPTVATRPSRRVGEALPPRLSLDVDDDELDGVVPVAQTVPRWNLRLDVARRVGCARAQRMPAGCGVPLTRPFLPVVGASRRLEL